MPYKSKGEKAEYQRHFMRRYRAEGRDPRSRAIEAMNKEAQRVLLVRPSANDGKTLVVRPTEVPRPYIPGQHYQPGDRVLVQRGRQIVEAVMPRLDMDGNPMPE